MTDFLKYINSYLTYTFSLFFFLPPFRTSFLMNAYHSLRLFHIFSIHNSPALILMQFTYSFILRQVMVFYKYTVDSLSLLLPPFLLSFAHLLFVFFYFIGYRSLIKRIQVSTFRKYVSSSTSIQD